MIKYMDLVRGMKKLRNANMSVVLIITGVLGRVLKNIVKGLEEL